MSHLPALPPEGQIELFLETFSSLPTYGIGRKPENEIILSNGKISGQHARLVRCSASCFMLEDLTSKHGTFVNDVRISRKVVGLDDKIRFADAEYTVKQLLGLLVDKHPSSVETRKVLPEPHRASKANATLEFAPEFAELQQVYEQYPKLRRDCRNREKMIRTGSVILSSLVGVSAVLTTGGGAVPFIQLMSGAGLSMLIPTLCSTLLSTDEKLEIIDKEYREKYRCPNPACRDPFGTREWELLAQQKTCRRCQAVWVN
ncbi:FHA domain-containing protein [Larkinella arboricola]|uniref:FHA domain-containing protein n=1 Tax=Larkinella arboricola TaxID=643671 RepID=A0A327WPE6_LARAB|nr:FHA domain-containing protein [Larkinella arboricola]RAJ93088.1 FHA domain-containing protein [Larkinella arboricola]